MKNSSFLKTLDWEIETRELLLGNSAAARKKVIVRSDSSEVIGLVGQGYSPVHNGTLMKIASAIENTGKFDLDGFAEHKNGSVIQCFLSNKNIYLNINGHRVFESMVITNSHNGTTKFSIWSQTRMERCGNIYSRPLKVYSRKLLQPVDASKVNVEEIISVYMNKKEKMYSDFDGMDKIRVSSAIVSKLITEIYRMLNNDSRVPKENEWQRIPSMKLLKDSIDKEMAALGNNLFGLFNGVTWYTSHEMRNSDSTWSRFNGTAAEINQKAFRFCNNLKHIHLKDNN
jgi:hypothetical protein